MRERHRVSGRIAATLPNSATETIASHRARTRRGSRCPGCADGATLGDWIRTLGRGAAGWLRSAIGRDGASPEVYGSRWEACGACDENDAGVCRRCACILPVKVRLTYERCPLGRWRESDDDADA